MQERKERASENKPLRKNNSKQTHTDPNRTRNTRKDKVAKAKSPEKTRHHQAHPREPRRTDTPEHHLGEWGPKRPLAETPRQAAKSGRILPNFRPETP